MFWGTLGSQAKAAIDRIGKMWNDLMKWVQGVIGNMQAAWQKYSGMLAPILVPAQKALEAIFGGISSAWNSTVTFMEDRFKEGVANIINYSNPLDSAPEVARR